jgi:hypothetical protein
MSKPLASWLYQTPLTPAGLPQLREGEITYVVKPGAVTVENTRFTTVQVTSHRIMFTTTSTASQPSQQQPPQQRHLSGELVAISRIKLEAVNFFSRSARPLVIALSPQRVAPPYELRVSCQTSHDAEEVAAELQKSIDRKAWAVKEKVRPSPGEASRPLGISGLMRQRELDKRHTGRLATEAFTDLQALMSQAQTVVGIMERYQSQLAEVERAGDGAAGSGGGAPAGDEEKKQLRDLLDNIGISSPVTKSSAGSAFHQQLSRELADFLKAGNHLQRAGGMLTLPDVYCIFNRARGLALISPDDLFEAASLLSVIGLGMALRTFDSGVVVVQAAAHEDVSMSERILELAKAHIALTVFRVSVLLDVPITLAREHLNTAEQLGRIARDEGPDGEVLYYENLFY